MFGLKLPIFTSGQCLVFAVMTSVKGSFGAGNGFLARPCRFPGRVGFRKIVPLREACSGRMRLCENCMQTQILERQRKSSLQVVGKV